MGRSSMLNSGWGLHIVCLAIVQPQAVQSNMQVLMQFGTVHIVDRVLNFYNSLISLYQVGSQKERRPLKTTPSSMAAEVLILPCSRPPNQSQSQSRSRSYLLLLSLQLIHIPIRPNQLSMQEVRLWTRSPNHEVTR